MQQQSQQVPRQQPMQPPPPPPPKQQWKEQRRKEGADVVEREHVRDHILEAEAILQDAHEQRNLESNENTDEQHDAVQRGAERFGVGEGEEQDQRRQAADHPHQHLHQHESRDDPAHDEAREPAADPHGEQIRADDGGKLRDTITKQIRRQRAGDELIDEPTGGNETNGDEQRERH